MTSDDTTKLEASDLDALLRAGCDGNRRRRRRVPRRAVPGSAVICAKFNGGISARLCHGALDALDSYGIDPVLGHRRLGSGCVRAPARGHEVRGTRWRGSRRVPRCRDPGRHRALRLRGGRVRVRSHARESRYREYPSCSVCSPPTRWLRHWSDRCPASPTRVTRRRSPRSRCSTCCPESFRGRRP